VHVPVPDAPSTALHSDWKESATSTVPVGVGPPAEVTDTETENGPPWIGERGVTWVMVVVVAATTVTADGADVLAASLASPEYAAVRV